MKIKILDSLNWLEQDSSNSFYINTSDNSFSPLTGVEWLINFLEPKLPESIPIEVIELYEVARGCLLYGHFFYPLYTVGHNQLFLVLDSATLVKGYKLGMIDAEDKNYSERLKFLFNKGYFNKEKKEQWDAARQLRNKGTHSCKQMLLTPIDALNALYQVRNDLIDLFKNDTDCV